MNLPDSPQVDDQHWFEKHVEVLFLLVLFTESLSAPEDEAVEGFDSSRLIRRFALLDGDVEADIGDGVVESTESFFLIEFKRSRAETSSEYQKFQRREGGKGGRLRASTVCKGLTEFGLPHDHTQAPHLLVWSEGPPSPLILRYYWDMTGLPSRVTGSRWDPQKAILDSFVGLEMEPFSKYVSVLSAGRSASSNESSSEDILSAMKYAGSDSDSQGALEQLDDCFILALYRRGEKRIHNVMSVQSFFRVFRNKLGLNAPAKSSTKFGGVR